MPALAPERIESLYRAACLAELDALKVGNVHAYAGGHRMETADFVASAEVSAPFLAAAGARVGERVRGAVAATRARVGQNTNLGILLLCAPLARAAESAPPLRAALATVLDDGTEMPWTWAATSTWKFDTSRPMPESTAMAKELKRRGFKFFGPTTAHALMQATGMVDDHVAGCWVPRLEN